MLQSKCLRLASYYAYATAVLAQWYVVASGCLVHLLAAVCCQSVLVFLVSPMGGTLKTVCCASRCEASRL
jgi:hypothetical protein